MRWSHVTGAAIAATTIALAAVSPAAHMPAAATTETTPAQVERAHARAQKCRTILGAPPFATRHHWRTTPSPAYRAWMLQLWHDRAERCQTRLDRAVHTHPLVAARYVFPEWTWERWRIIIGCETGWTYSNRVIGAAGETSGFQIHPPSHPWYDKDRGHRDALYAAQSARRVLHSQGWAAWSCARINGLA